MDPSALLFRILSSLVIFGQSLMPCMAGREECEDRFWPKAYIFFFLKDLIVANLTLLSCLVAVN